MDRRTFLAQTSIVAVGAALKGVLPAAAAVLPDPTPAAAFIRRRIKSGTQPSEIAYCPWTKYQFQKTVESLTDVVDLSSQNFRTLTSALYRKVIVERGGTERLLMPHDYVQFLMSLPPEFRDLAHKKILEDRLKRLAAKDEYQFQALQRFVDPGCGYFEGPNSDEIDCYAVYKIWNGLIDFLNLYARGMETEARVDPREVKLAVLDGGDSPFIYKAAARNLFRDVDEIVFIDG